MAHGAGLTESIAGSRDLLPIDFAPARREEVCTVAPPVTEESATRTDSGSNVGAGSAPSSRPVASDSRFVALPWILLVERCVVTCSATLAVIIFVFGLGSPGDLGSSEVHPSQHAAGYAFTSGADREFHETTVIPDEFALLRNHSFVLEFWQESPDNGTPASDTDLLDADTSIREANISFSASLKKNSP